MISGVSNYSSYSYSSTLASTQRSNPVSNGGNGAADPAKIQEKLFSILDGNGDGSVAKDELNSALTSAKESDSSLTIDIDELFSQLDANGDGSLDSQETAAMAPPPPSGRGGPRGPNPEEMFAQLDSNSDGSIDLDELTALAEQAETDVSSLFSALDSDGDGGLNIDEMSALAPPPPPPPQSQSNNGELFNQLQADSGTGIRLDKLSSLLDSVAQAPGKRVNEEESDSALITKLLKQYQSNASYQTSIGSQLDLSA